MTTFKMAFHMMNGRRIVEVYEGNTLIAGLYPDDEPRAFRIVSKHAITTTKPDDAAPNAITVKIGDAV